VSCLLECCVDGFTKAKYYSKLILKLPITVAARSKAVFARSDAGIVGSNPTRGMDLCVCAYSVFVLFCIGSGLSTS
jgi:hypothetical protein